MGDISKIGLGLVSTKGAEKSERLLLTFFSINLRPTQNKKHENKFPVLTGSWFTLTHFQLYKGDIVKIFLNHI